MFAVVKTGGKQYRVAENDLMKVEKLDAEAGDTVVLDQVLMVGDGDDRKVGAPLIEGAVVEAEVVEQTRAKKIIVFKKKRRQNYRRKKGHRQHQTVLKVIGISLDGPKKQKAKAAAPTADDAAPKKAAAKKAVKKASAKKAGAKKTSAKKAAAKKADAATGDES